MAARFASDWPQQLSVLARGDVRKALPLP